MIHNRRVWILFALQFAVATGAAVTALFHVQEGVVAGIATLGVSGMTLRWAWSVRDRKDALKPYSDGVAMAGLGAFVLLLFSQGLLLGLIALLVAMQLAMNLVLREYRQLYFGLVISFVLIMCGAAESLSGGYLLALLIYGLISSFCFGEMWLDQHPAEDLASHRPTIRRRLQVAGLVLCLAVVFYLVLPRPPAANVGSQLATAAEYYSNEQWEEAADGSDGQSLDSDPRDPSREVDEGRGEGAESGTEAEEAGEAGDHSGFGYSGFNEQFDIRDPGEEDGRNTNAILAYMKAPHGSYLTLRTFDIFDGISWSASTSGRRKQRLERGRITLEENRPGNFRQVFRIQADLPAFIPVAPRPVELWLPASVIALDPWDQPLLPGPLRAGTRYTVASHVEWYRNRLVNGARSPWPTERQLPENMDARIAALARRVTAGAADDFERARRLEQHLRTEYDYSFQSAFDSQGETPLPKFLFEERVGHCEYFASAMVVMLRTLDIPARLVTGFSATHKNPMTGYYEIRGLDGHAWAEAWIPEAGWVTFEPTAFYDLPRPGEERLSAGQINEYVERLRRSEEVLGGAELTAGNLLAGLWHALASLFVVITAWLKLAWLTLWPLLLVLLLAAIGLVSTHRHWQPRLSALFSHWRIRRYRPRDAREALHFYLHHLQQMAAGQGIDRLPGEPVKDWGRRLKAIGDEDGAGERLAEMVNQHFYREHPMALDPIREAALAVARGLTGKTGAN